MEGSGAASTAMPQGKSNPEISEAFSNVPEVLYSLGSYVAQRGD